MIAVGVVGFGHWGPNHTRILSADPEATLAFVCDESADRCRVAATRHPGVPVTTDVEVALTLADVDAIIVATPAETHATVVRTALDAGLHVLAEKPLGMSATEVEAMIEAARAADRTLMVDHTYLFSQPVARLQELVVAGLFDGPFAYRSIRTNPHHVAGPVGVMRDLAVHDLSILDALHARPPTSVSATRPGTESDVDLVEVRLTYADGSTASVAAGWGTRDRSRRAVLEGSSATVVYDDLARGREIDVRTADDSLQPARVDWSSSGSLGQPHDVEPLSGVLRHFVTSIEQGTEPLTSGDSALRIARVLDGARQSLTAGGDEVELGALEALG